VNVAIFGGSFNPPHVAHVLAVAYVLSSEPIDELLVIPCYRHPFAKELAPFEDRFAMCERAMGWIPKTRVSRVEEELGGESWTLRTVQHLRSVRPTDELRLIVGADVLVEGKRWRGFDELRELAPFIVLGRAGHAAPDCRVLLPDVSSTMIRQALREGRRADLAGLVPRSVLDYLDTHPIYRAT
jgi:nicotinate-nucleotide adenylyltransferase